MSFWLGMFGWNRSKRKPNPRIRLFIPGQSRPPSREPDHIRSGCKRRRIRAAPPGRRDTRSSPDVSSRSRVRDGFTTGTGPGGGSEPGHRVHLLDRSCIWDSGTVRKVLNLKSIDDDGGKSRETFSRLNICCEWLSATTRTSFRLVFIDVTPGITDWN